MEGGCPFCGVNRERILVASVHGAAIADQYPVAPGHTLVIPIRHVASLYDLSTPEQADLWQLVAQVRDRLQTERSPAGFNIGLNDGPAAGQTIGHAHIHVIPRYAGDMTDPRGGVRWVLPSKAKYWD